MGNIAELKPLSQKRGGDLSSFARNQQMQAQMPQYLKQMTKQLATLQSITKEQYNLLKKQTAQSQSEIHWMEQIHDRLDSLIVESRVTNLLLAELIALQRVVIPEETDGNREAVRNDAYRRILNGE